MENLQLVLSVLGAIAIIAVLVHGFWSIRKQQPKSLKDSPMSGFYKAQSANRDPHGFDVDGIGEVRVLKHEPNEGDNALADTAISDTVKNEPQFNSAADNLSQDDVEMTFDSEDETALSEQDKNNTGRQRQEPAFSSPTQDPEPLNQMKSAASAIKAPVFKMDNAQLQTKVAVKTGSPIYAAPVTQPRAKAAPKSLDKTKPLAKTHSLAKTKPLSKTKPSAKTEPKVAEQGTLDEPRDVLVLHVVAAEGEVIHGADLLPNLLTLNFKFGDMSIFHRHEDYAGTGKAIFSLANMVKPGIFNPDEMEQFSTEGVVLFMTLPCHGEALMNFSIMLNCAHQLADDLGGQVLDGGRDSWSDATKQGYLQRIRTQST